MGPDQDYYQVGFIVWDKTTQSIVTSYWANSYVIYSGSWYANVGTSALQASSGRYTIDAVLWDDIYEEVEDIESFNLNVIGATYTLSYTAGPGGTIGGAAQQTVNQYGSGSAVTAVPNAGYRFVRWSDGLTTATRTDTNVTANKGVSAEFAAVTYTLSYAAGPGGGLSGAPQQTVAQYGSGTAVTAVPSAGYRFVRWSDGLTTATRTDTNVTSNKSFTAEFAANTFTLTYSAGVGGSITGSSVQAVSQNGNGTAVTAIANSGYRFVKWSDGIMTAERTDRTVVADKSVTAEFEKVLAAASISRTPNKSSVSYTRKKGVAKFKLSAVIRGWGGSSIPGRPVYLQTSKDGETWDNTYALEMSATGKASKSFSIKTKQVRYYRWYVPAYADLNLESYSAKTKVSVK